MESYPLNKAHQLHRRAEALSKQKKFDESIECHRSAIKYLQQASQSTENARSKESIHLQISGHQKQMDSLRIKKTQFEDLQQYQDALRHRAVNFDCLCENGENLQNEIFRTMETHDSLIEVLMKRNCDDECLESCTSEDDNTSSVDMCDGVKIPGKKRQVDDSILLEEFRGLSEKLRELVQILVLQLEEKDNEIARLKAEMYRLECDRNKDGLKPSNTLKVVTDSSGGSSPYVFSPCSELSPEVHDIQGLPSLAPLDMPNFDFASLIKNANTLNLNGTNN